MSILSTVKRIFTKKETTTTTNLAPTTQPSVTSVDVGTKTQERVGGITVVGGTRTSGGGVSGGTIVQSDIPVDVAQRLTGSNPSTELQEQKRIPTTTNINIQRQAVIEQQRQAQNVIYYRSMAGYPSTNNPDFQRFGYFETDAQGNIKRRIPDEEAKRLGLTPTNEVQASDKKQGFVSKVVNSKGGQRVIRTYETANKNLSTAIKTVTPEPAPTEVVVYASSFGPSPFAFINRQATALSYELAKGFYQDVRDKPLKNIVLFGAGEGLGYTVESGSEFLNYGKSIISNSRVVTALKPTVTNFNQVRLLETGELSATLKTGSSIGKVVGIGVGGYTIGQITYVNAVSSTSKEEFLQKTGASIGNILFFSEGFSKGYTKAGEPIITKEIPQQVKGTYSEARVPYINAEGNVEFVSKYKIKGIVMPKQIEITTRPREFFGFEPIKELSPIGKPYTFNVETPFYAKTNKEFITISRQRNIKAVNIISGTGESVDIRANFNRLTKIDKRLVEELSVGEGFVLNGGKYTRITKIRNIEPALIFKNLPRESLYQAGEITETTIVKLPKNQPTTKKSFFESMKLQASSGKSKEIYRYLGKFTEVPTSEKSAYPLTQGEISYKRVTMPLSRSTGTIQRLKGTTATFKEPVADFSPEKYNSITPNYNIKKTPFSSTFTQEQNQQLKTLIKKPTSIPPPIKATTIKPNYETSNLLQHQTTSQYYGTGQYERTTGGQTPRVNMKEFSLSINIPTTREKLNQSPAFKLNQEEKIIMGEKLSPTEKLFSNEQPKLREKQLTKQNEKQLQKVVQKLGLKLNPTPNITPTRTNFNTRNNKIIPQPRLKKEPKQNKSSKGFAVLVRRFGKFKVKGFGLSFQQAGELGKSIAKNSLAASYEIYPNVKMKAPKGFYEKQTREGLIFIQKRSGRLSTTGEKSEIQFFKRLKGGNKRK